MSEPAGRGKGYTGYTTAVGTRVQEGCQTPVCGSSLAVGYAVRAVRAVHALAALGSANSALAPRSAGAVRGYAQNA